MKLDGRCVGPESRTIVTKYLRLNGINALKSKALHLFRFLVSIILWSLRINGVKWRIIKFFSICYSTFRVGIKKPEGGLGCFG